jgi:hypothetical protein
MPKVSEPTDLDLLMNYLADLDAKDPTLWTNKDIDVIIEYQRRARAQREAGVKPKRAKAESVVKLTLADLGFKPKPPAPGKGLRRL